MGEIKAIAVRNVFVATSRGALPRPACGERVGVRGYNRLDFNSRPLTRLASMMLADLSPRAGRGEDSPGGCHL
jgi:hypothetical protein